MASNVGPAAARNAALDVAQGDWVAIIDADDLIHPQRIERLLSAARSMDVSMIADDLVFFGSVGAAGQTLLGSRQVKGPLRITSTDLIRSDTAAAGLKSFGYLKPLIRSDVLGSLRYDETLRVGEDFDLYSRVLLGGADFLVLPDPTYLYRRHSGSISHRLSVPVLEKIINAHDAATKLSKLDHPQNDALQAALFKRGARLAQALRYEHLVKAVKSRNALRAAQQIVRDPALLAGLAASLVDRLRRVAPKMRPRPFLKTRTLVLATPDRLALISAPPGAIFIPVSPIRTSVPMIGAPRRSIVCRIVKLSSQAPVDIIAEGPDSLDVLGYVPAWRSVHLFLEAKAAHAATVPPGVVLELLPEYR